MKACAVAAFADVDTTAVEYSTSTLRSGGISTMSASPDSVMSVAYTIAASNVWFSTRYDEASRRLGDHWSGLAVTPAASRTRRASTHRAPPARTARVAVRIAEIVDAGDAGGIPDRHDDRHHVGGEDDGLRAGQDGS